MDTFAFVVAASSQKDAHGYLAVRHGDVLKPLDDFSPRKGWKYLQLLGGPHECDGPGTESGWVRDCDAEQIGFLGERGVRARVVAWRTDGHLAVRAGDVVRVRYLCGDWAYAQQVQAGEVAGALCCGWVLLSSFVPFQDWPKRSPASDVKAGALLRPLAPPPTLQIVLIRESLLADNVLEELKRRGMRHLDVVMWCDELSGCPVKPWHEASIVEIVEHKNFRNFLRLTHDQYRSSVHAGRRRVGDLPMYVMAFRDREAWGAGELVAEIMAHIARTVEGLRVQILHLSPPHQSVRRLQMPGELRGTVEDAKTQALEKAGRLWGSL
jgi:hypothetical protein